MSNISPKLINIDAGRIPSKNNDHFRGKVYKAGNFQNGVDKVWVATDSPLGRFPTQLFTNIKNEQYKYVKRINI
jgi:hypothetical protein